MTDQKIYEKRMIALMNSVKSYYNAETNEMISEDGNEILTSDVSTLNLGNIVKDKLRLGQWGEEFAAYIFDKLGYTVYRPLVDNNGIDLLVKSDEIIYKVQVKTVNAGTYVYIPEKKMKDLISDNYIFFYTRIKDGMPLSYIFPSTVWKEFVGSSKSKRDGKFVFKAYNKMGLKSKPEFGIYGSEKEFCADKQYWLEIPDWKDETSWSYHEGKKMVHLNNINIIKGNIAK